MVWLTIPTISGVNFSQRPIQIMAAKRSMKFIVMTIMVNRKVDLSDPPVSTSVAPTGTHNRIIEDEHFLYQHDANGNLVKKLDKDNIHEFTYTYDIRNRLTKITRRLHNGNVWQIVKIVQYEYDLFNRRISKKIFTTSNVKT